MASSLVTRIGLGVAALSMPLTMVACSSTATTATTTDSTTTTTAAAVNAGQTVTINTVSANKYSYDPTPVTVKVGQTVTWTNASGTNHTVTADAGQSVNFKSQVIKDGENYVFSFSAAGTYQYFCSIHSKTSMSGTIVVT